MRKYKYMGLLSVVAIWGLSGCALHKGVAKDSDRLSSAERQKFEYLYLEDKMSESSRLNITFDKIRDFFKDGN